MTVLLLNHLIKFCCKHSPISDINVTKCSFYRWKNRKSFEKVPGKFFPMDIDLGAPADEVAKLEVSKSKSKLDVAIQELVALIFDIETMKKALVEFEIDLTKMPLGKISRKQIEKAYKILTEAQVD